MINCIFCHQINDTDSPHKERQSINNEVAFKYKKMAKNYVFLFVNCDLFTSWKWTFLGEKTNKIARISFKLWKAIPPKRGQRLKWVYVTTKLVNHVGSILFLFGETYIFWRDFRNLRLCCFLEMLLLVNDLWSIRWRWCDFGGCGAC